MNLIGNTRAILKGRITPSRSEILGGYGILWLNGDLRIVASAIPTTLPAITGLSTELS